MLRQTIYTAPLSALNVIKTFEYTLWLYIGDVGSCRRMFYRKTTKLLPQEKETERERKKGRLRIGRE